MARSPLFNYYDPYGELDMRAQMGLLPPDEEDVDEFGMPRPRTRATLSDLMPEEERRSLLGTLANAGASGLTGLGWILDTPGAAVRGTISGLMEGDPLKGVRDIFASSDERTSGRDLLRQAGLVGRDDNWANFSAGLASEILTDPLLFLNPLAMVGKGAASTAGRVMGRAGLLEDAALMARRLGAARGRPMGQRELMRMTPNALLRERALPPGAMERFSAAARGKGLDPDALMNMPMAGVMEARIPGTEIGHAFSFGQAGDRLAQGLDAFGEGLTRNPITAPVVNRFTRAFDNTVLGRLDPDEQWRAREAVAGARGRARGQREQLQAVLGEARAADAATLPEALRGFDSDRIQNAIRDTIEAGMEPERMAALVDQDAVAAIDAVPEWREYRQYLIDTLEEAQQRRAALGLQTPTAQSLYDTGYFPSQRREFPGAVQTPNWPGRAPPVRRPYERGDRVFSMDDLVGQGRNPAYDLERRSETLRRLQGGQFGADLRDRMFGASPDQLPQYIDDAFVQLGLEPAYSRTRSRTGRTQQELTDFLADPALSASERAPVQAELDALLEQQRQYKIELGETLRTADRRFADANAGLFDRHTSDDILRYVVGGSRSDASAEVALDILQQAASPIPAGQMPMGGSVNLLDSAATLGFDRGRLRRVLEARMPGADIDNLSVPQNVVRSLEAYAPRARRDPSSILGRTYDSFTNLFKIGALAYPAYHTRNAYSGYLSSLASGEFNPIELARSTYAGVQAGRGNFRPMLNRLRNSPLFAHISDDDELIRQVQAMAARNEMGQGLVMDGASQARNLAIGGDDLPPITFYDPNRSWTDWATVRGVDFSGAASGRAPPPETLNPLLQVHERVARRVEEGNRLGPFIDLLRQGVNPDAASNVVNRTQVDYAPQAFTEFERGLKRIFPFYSWTRGITPSIVDNLLNRPGGLQGQVTRSISDVGRPSEDFFLPDHLRQTASIPLPFTLGDEGQLQRVLTNVDVPWEGPVNLITPGAGNNFVERLGSSLQKTGLNILGMANPVIKAPLEMLTNRQLYSGREMSDLYSMLEQGLGPIGRPIEQLLVNAPFGSRAVSIARTAMDDRMTPQERALKLLINNVAGVKVTDVDVNRTRELAARNTLNDLLRTTGGVRTYENITVPDEALERLSPQQRDLYLLYRILQGDAAKRARRRRREEEMQDPLAMLAGVR